MNGVIAGTVWRHYKGTAYRVLAIAHDEADRGKLIVVYTEHRDGDAPVWARPLASWQDYVEGGPRYTLVGGPTEGGQL